MQCPFIEDFYKINEILLLFKSSNPFSVVRGAAARQDEVMLWCVDGKITIDARILPVISL